MIRSVIMAVLFNGIPPSIEATTQPLHGLIITIPTDWTKRVLSPTSVALIPSNNVGLIGLTLYKFDQLIDSSTIRKKRESTLYDGWIVRYARKSTPTERQLVSADSRELIVYGQSKLSSENKVIHTMIVEHYLTKGLKGYAISIQTDESNWPRLEQSIKQLLQSIRLK